MFGNRSTARLFFLDNLVGGDAEESHAYDEPDTHPEVRESDRAGGEVVCPLKYERHGGKEEVQNAVVDSDVYGHEAHHR